MTQAAPETRSPATQAEALTCPQCHALFMPARPTQSFCSSRCRGAFHTDRGTEGQVVSVRRINKGASVVIHLTGPAAESALRLTLRQPVRVVSKP